MFYCFLSFLKYVNCSTVLAGNRSLRSFIWLICFFSLQNQSTWVNIWCISIFFGYYVLVFSLDDLATICIKSNLAFDLWEHLVKPEASALLFCYLVLIIRHVNILLQNQSTRYFKIKYYKFFVGSGQVICLL